MSAGTSVYHCTDEEDAMGDVMRIATERKSLRVVRVEVSDPEQDQRICDASPTIGDVASVIASVTQLTAVLAIMISEYKDRRLVPLRFFRELFKDMTLSIKTYTDESLTVSHTTGGYLDGTGGGNTYEPVEIWSMRQVCGFPYCTGIDQLSRRFVYAKLGSPMAPRDDEVKDGKKEGEVHRFEREFQAYKREPPPPPKSDAPEDTYATLAPARKRFKLFASS